MTNVELFLQHLNATAPKPAGAIYIACHASVDGFLGIDLDVEPKGEQQHLITDPDEVMAAEKAGSVTIDPSLVDADTTFRIRGCEIGGNTKFLGLLKAALGGVVTVNAPRFFDNFQPLESGRRLGGMFEWFNYVFVIRRPTRFADRDAALAEFVANTATFKFIDGSSVPDTGWDTWLAPKTDPIWTYTGLGVAITSRNNVVPLGQTVLGFDTLDAGSHMTAWQRRIVTNLPDLKPSDPATPANPRLDTEADMRAFAKAKLPTQERFTAVHRLPVYEQYGFASLDLMVDGISWTVEMTDPAKGERRLVGTQFEYAVGPPVLDGLGNLCFNFERGPDAPAATASIVGVAETNATFFGTV